MSNNSEKVDPRILRTRELLRQALMDLATEKSFVSISIQEVAQRAGVNRSTFYLHYMGLHELLEDCGRQLMGELRMEIYQMVEESLRHERGNYEPYIRCVFEHLKKYLRFYKAMLGKGGDPYFTELFRKLLEELIFEPLQGETSSEAEGEVILSFFSSGFAGVANWWLQNNAVLPAEEAARLVNDDLLPASINLFEGGLAK